MRHLGRLAASLAVSVVALAWAGSALAASDVVISQVYGGGGNSNATYTNDFVELYNRGATDVNVTGWTVRYASALGTSWQQTILSGTIAAGGYYLVQEAAGAGGTVPLPTPDATGSIPMSATAGKVALVTDVTPFPTGTSCPAVADFVGYGTTSTTNCYEGAGPTGTLSNTTAARRKLDGAQDTDNNAADFDIGAPNPRNSGFTPPPPSEIAEIQAAGHVSPKVGELVGQVEGIVTAKRTNGFYMQDPTPDLDPATSDGIFVFTGSEPAVAVGDDVSVTARVQEFRPGDASNANLSTTELSSPTIVVLSSGNGLPAATTIGTGGLVPPSMTIEDDATGSVETSGIFDPAFDGIDFWESLEGMRLVFPNAVAVGPTNPFGETPIANDDANASVRTPRGGLLLRATDQNPERIFADDVLVPLPALNVGDHYSGPLEGVLDYSFGNFLLDVTTARTRVDSGLQRETTAEQSLQQLSVATFNVENLDPGDGAAKFSRLAELIVSNLKAPDLVTLEEVQDNNGPTNDAVTNADVTLNTLVAAIQAAGGPKYAYRYIDPVDDQDGGEPGGNIRIAFLFRTDRGLVFVDATGATPTTANEVVAGADGPHLRYSPGRIDPTNSAWATSRKPLAAEFQLRGRTFFVIGDHFNSKGGDDPIMGRFQPPTRSSEAQRHLQAQVERDFVDSILDFDPNANIVVLGDLNDFQYSETVQILTAGGALRDLIDTLPVNERYSYEFEGNAQVLDHILASANPLDRYAPSFDVVHVNAEFADQASDHDPSVVRLSLPTTETLCTLVKHVVTKPGVAKALCDKLAAGAYGEFVELVDAQTGKAISPADAALLKQLVSRL